MNLIFDLGGVVFVWEPDAIIAGVFAEEEARARVRAEIFAHADWQALDRGTLELPEAIRRGAARTGLPPGAVARLLGAVPPALVPIPGTMDLLRRLKAGGHRLFYLSNMHKASIEYVMRAYSFWDLFAGGVVSCRVHLVKPEPEIYTHLLGQYGLAPSGAVFIDDTPVNLEAAARLGLRTIEFRDPAQCARQLEAWGIC